MILKKTNHTPFVELTNEHLIIQGESRPEDSYAFYLPICQHLESLDLVKEFKVEFEFDYVSSSSMLFLKQLLLTLGEMQNIEYFKITWKYFELDEDSKEVGEILIQISNVKMNIIKVIN
jgi:hypothetical protein